MDNPSIREILAASNLKYTSQRAAILELLQNSDLPMTAQEITAILNKNENSNPFNDGDDGEANGNAAGSTQQESKNNGKAKTKKDNKTYWTSTVYRTLDLLLEADLVTRIDIPNNEKSCFIMHKHNTDRHFAICLKCRKIISLSHCPIHPIQAELDAHNFAIANHRMEIYGYCEACQVRTDEVETLPTATENITIKS